MAQPFSPITGRGVPAVRGGAPGARGTRGSAGRARARPRRRWLRRGRLGRLGRGRPLARRAEPPPAAQPLPVPSAVARPEAWPVAGSLAGEAVVATRGAVVVGGGVA